MRGQVGVVRTLLFEIIYLSHLGSSCYFGNDFAHRIRKGLCPNTMTNFFVLLLSNGQIVYFYIITCFFPTCFNFLLFPCSNFHTYHVSVKLSFTGNFLQVYLG